VPLAFVDSAPMTVISYARVPVPLDAALQRFAAWIGLSELEPPRRVRSLRSVDEACTDGEWRGVAVFAHEANGWTVLEDYTGYLGMLPAERWIPLAGDEELVFAGYNDAVPYGQLIVVRHGRVVREFLHDVQDPSQNVNRGRLERERTEPMEDWVDAARFVDDDELADDGADEGTLLLYVPDMPLGGSAAPPSDDR
jgi:hypothetical protein